MEKKFDIKNLLTSYLPSDFSNSFQKKLVIVFGCLGDFDSLEYACNIAREIKYGNLQISLYAFGIGDSKSKKEFCDFTGFTYSKLQVFNDNSLHNKLKLFKGPLLPLPNWINMLLMCGGYSSPGTLREVLRGYTGDKSAMQLFSENKSIKFGIIPEFPCRYFNIAGRGFQRPFELASLRLINMIEVISKWRIYIPNSSYLTQRGATYILSEKNDLLYRYEPKSLLSYSSTMNDPLGIIRRYNQ